MSEILYHDAQVTIYRELILINKYYFPLATSKTIMFSEIERISLLSADGVNHKWGLCTKHLNNWFPLDSERKNKSKFIEIILKGRKTRPSITPQDPDKVFKIFWENFTPEGKELVQKMSEQVGKETEIAQQELLERERESMEVSEQQLSAGNKKSLSVEK